MQPLTDEIEKKQLGWWGHLNRMNSDRQVKSVWEARDIQRRSRGRPKETWNNVIVKTLQKKNTTWHEAQKLCVDKKKWKKFVEE